MTSGYAAPQDTLESHLERAKKQTAGYQICRRCIMDTSDPDIRFDEKGECNHCTTYDDTVRDHLHLGEEAAENFQRQIRQVKAEGKKKEYDCIIGVSGGVDSSYLAYKSREWGLRPLAVHLDNGWDSRLAVSNIERLLKGLDIDLYTHVLDWEEFRDLQLSFLRASTPDAEAPTDHAIGAVLWKVAAEKRTRFIIHGSNVRTEAIMPKAWSARIADWTYIRAIHREFGHVRLKTFPHLSAAERFFHVGARRLRLVRGLNYIPYDKKDAIDTLAKEFAWERYGGKHYESIYTRFFQGYILPKKFGYDKRRAHLSTLIGSGQLSRDEALEEIEKDAYPPGLLREDLEFALKKLALTREAFEEIMALPPRPRTDYRSQEDSAFFNAGRSIYRRLLGPG